MKKLFVWLLIAAFVTSMAFMGIGCKKAAETTTAAAETTAAAAETTTAAETTAAAETTKAGGGAGKTINIILNVGPVATALVPIIDAFVTEKGMKVNISVAPYHSMLETITLALEADKGAYDVVEVSSSWLAGLIKAGFIKSMDQIDPDIMGTLNDIFTVDGKLYAQPYRPSPQIVFYRTDLFTKYNLKMPDNLNDLIPIAQKLTLDTNGDGEIDIYGMPLPGAPTGHLTTEFYMVLWSMGGEVFDNSGKPIFNDAKGLQALQYMLDLAYKYKVVPPWFLESRVDTHMTEFAQGKLAMVFAYPSFVQTVFDKSKSQVADKVGLTIRPGVGLASAWGLAVTGRSDVAKESLELVQFLTNVDNTKTLCMATGSAAIRRSVLEDKELNAAWPFQQQVYLPAMDKGHAYPPVQLPQYAEVETIIYTELNSALAKAKDPQVALDDAVKQIKSLLGQQ